MISRQASSKLLATLYAVPLDEAQWQILLTQFCEVTGSRIGFVLRNDSNLGNRTLASGGIPVPPQVEQTFKAARSYSDPFRQALPRNPASASSKARKSFPVISSSPPIFTATSPFLAAWSMPPPWSSPSPPALLRSSACGAAQIAPSSKEEHRELLTLLMPHKGAL
jgi:hypothetical protein